MLFITHVRLSSDVSGHEHITEVRWSLPTKYETGTSKISAMVAWLESGNRAHVRVGKRAVEVHVVHGAQKHLRTQADGHWSDNLLALPRF